MSTTLRAAEAGWTYASTNNIVIMSCPSCGLSYGIPETYRNRRRDDGKDWYCPNGHSIVFRETETDRLRKRAETAERQAKLARDNERFFRDQAAAERRSAAAYKGQVTKIKNRIAQGICPVPGCKRSGFEKVERHIHAKHPDWVSAHPGII